VLIVDAILSGSQQRLSKGLNVSSFALFFIASSKEVVELE